MATIDEIGSGRRAFITGDVWSKLEFDLSEIRDLMDMRLETAEEAIGKRISPGDPKKGKKAAWRDTAPRWFDPQIGVSVFPWSMIPYIKAIDQERLQSYLEAGKRLLLKIERQIAARELSPELLLDWGLLNQWAGALQLVYFANSDIGHQRSAEAGGVARIDDAEAHQRWFAYYFLKRYKRGNRKPAERAVEQLINAIVDGLIALPVGYGVDWFEQFLDLMDPIAPSYTKLKPTFNEHSLSVRRMEQLIEMGTAGIPPVDLDFPDP